MAQLSLRLVHPVRPVSSNPSAAPPAGGAAGEGPGVARSPRAETLERLRALVGARGRVGIHTPPPGSTAGPFALDPNCSSTGIADLDRWLHGWPRPGPIEIAGPIGSGRLALVTATLARLTRAGRVVVVVDPLQRLHPPGLPTVDFTRVVLVRPPMERAAWAAEQVARSGAVEAMVLVDAPPLGRGGVRLARAAEAGNVQVFVLAEAPERDLPAVLRLEVGGWSGERLVVKCSRSRDGRRIGERSIDVASASSELPAHPREEPRVSAGRFGARAGRA